jgi:hypothetical protein
MTERNNSSTAYFRLLSYQVLCLSVYVAVLIDFKISKVYILDEVSFNKFALKFQFPLKV